MQKQDKKKKKTQRRVKGTSEARGMHGITFRLLHIDQDSFQMGKGAQKLRVTRRQKRSESKPKAICNGSAFSMETKRAKSNKQAGF